MGIFRRKWHIWHNWHRGAWEGADERKVVDPFVVPPVDIASAPAHARGAHRAPRLVPVNDGDAGVRPVSVGIGLPAGTAHPETRERGRPGSPQVPQSRNVPAQTI